MKKKVGLILGCILFIILAVGSVPSGNKDNVEVKNNSSSQETQSSTNNSTEQQSQQETKKEYEISDVNTKSDQFATYVTCILKNNGEQKGYVQIMIPCYDKDGAKLGDALANVNDIEANGKWKFKAMFAGNEKPETCNVDNAKVSGF